MFKPKYQISAKLLENIKKVAILVSELNNRSFPETILLELEKIAGAQSSHSSTSIEGNPLPLTDVKKILKNSPENLRDSEREVLNYNSALEYLKTCSAKTMDLKFILKIHGLVMKDLLGKNNLAKLRKEPVFVNNPKIGQTIFWPPDHGDLKNLMNDLLGYINKNQSKLDPLILAGIFHKQFVIIHPFIDGNGRTTRLLTKYLLANLGLDTFNLFSFENYYNKNVTKYFKKVGELGNYYDLEVDFTEWLEYFTDGIIDELIRVAAILKKKSFSPESKLEKRHEKLLKYIEEHGYINDKLYSSITDKAKATRSLDFKKLIEMGMLERHGKGKNTYYKLK